MTSRINVEIAVARAEVAVAAHDEVRVGNADQRGKKYAKAHSSAMTVGLMPYLDRRGSRRHIYCLIRVLD